MRVMKRKSVLCITSPANIINDNVQNNCIRNKYAANACMNQVLVFRKKKSPCDEQGDNVFMVFSATELF